MEYLTSFYDSLRRAGGQTWRWLQEPATNLHALTLQAAVALLVILVLAYLFKLRDRPHRLERAMAKRQKKQRRKEVRNIGASKIVSAIEAAVLHEQITREEAAYLLDQVHKSLPEVDIKPSGKPWWHVETINVNAAKAASMRRLRAMGVNIAEKLERMKWRRNPSKKAKVLKSA